MVSCGTKKNTLRFVSLVKYPASPHRLWRLVSNRIPRDLQLGFTYLYQINLTIHVGKSSWWFQPIWNISTIHRVDLGPRLRNSPMEKMPAMPAIGPFRKSIPAIGVFHLPRQDHNNQPTPCCLKQQLPWSQGQCSHEASNNHLKRRRDGVVSRIGRGVPAIIVGFFLHAPKKINMEPPNWLFVDFSPFPRCNQVPCLFWGVYCCYTVLIKRRLVYVDRIIARFWLYSIGSMELKK